MGGGGGGLLLPNIESFLRLLVGRTSSLGLDEEPRPLELDDKGLRSRGMMEFIASGPGPDI